VSAGRVIEDVAVLYPEKSGRSVALMRPGTEADGPATLGAEAHVDAELVAGELSLRMEARS
jgi:hypothetical protein